jgi:hypothetical protein
MSETARPKRILSIDGGGLRGVVAIAFLKAFEAELERSAGSKVVLRDHFDLIGGTSTGAIVATALALGHTAGEIEGLYFSLASSVFQRRWNSVDGVQPRFSSVALEAQIASVVKGRTLGSSDLRPGGLAVVTKRLDTGSVWLLSNNPDAPYWDSEEHVGNRHYSLTRVVLASAAAPFFFAPQQITVQEGQAPGTFVDGSISPHNNPALALLQLVTIPGYGYAWPVGRERLEIVSVGCGTPRAGTRRNLFGSTAAGNAVVSLHSMISDCDQHVMTMMQALGHCPSPWKIDSEIGDLSGFCLAPDPLFTFHRLNVLLDQTWLKEQLGRDIDSRSIGDLARIDSLTGMRAAFELATAAAEKQVPAMFGR